MDNHTDDRDAGLPPVGSPEELEEALKWLEDLTARQGTTADLPNPIPSTTLDSPFNGLIDSEEGDLPDWLREVPKPLEADAYDAVEPESRLDWLAKMAQRESIEELPTLEWRRLAEPLQSSLVPEDSALYQEMALAEPADVTADESLPVEQAPLPAADDTATDDEAPAPDWVDAPDVVAEAQPDTPELEAPAAPATEMPAIGTLADEDFVESIELSADEELPPLDDLDAAMAWIEELAASQQAPIEEIPSVGDRALASKLMMEAGLSPNVLSLDELGSDSALVESMTPTHPFIEEEDFADTVVLVETMAADQGIVLDMPDEISPPVQEFMGDEDRAPIDDQRLDVQPLGEGDEATLAAPDEALSFDDAMAYLDEIAVVKLHEGGDMAIEPLTGEPPFNSADITVVEVADEIVAPAADDALSSADAPWADSAVIDAVAADLPDVDYWAEPAVEATMDEAEAPEDETAMVYSIEEPDLEATLSVLDEWALPPGKTLSGITAAMTATQALPARDLSSALAWLESSLTPPPAAPVTTRDLDETDLIARMPEDPDEVLAWLEQIAGDEPDVIIAPSASQVHTIDHVPAAPVPAPAAVEITETDLFEMPDDPDEAMAWLEGLAGGERLPAAPAPAMTDTREPITPAPAVVELEEAIAAMPEANVADETDYSLPAVAEDDRAAPPTPAKPTTRRRRRRGAAQQATPVDEQAAKVDEQVAPEAQPVPVQPLPVQPAEEVAAPEPPAEPRPAEKKAGASWIDLLKPLD